MSYSVNFPSKSIESKFHKVFTKIPDKKIKAEIAETIESLILNPYPYGKKVFKRLKPPVQFYHLTAQYRLRIGDYRILYDVDEKREIVWILALRKRSEKTYK